MGESKLNQLVAYSLDAFQRVQPVTKLLLSRFLPVYF
jgi:hypothetical protein